MKNKNFKLNNSIIFYERIYKVLFGCISSIKIFDNEIYLFLLNDKSLIKILTYFKKYSFSRFTSLIDITAVDFLGKKSLNKNFRYNYIIIC